MPRASLGIIRVDLRGTVAAPVISVSETGAHVDDVWEITLTSATL